MKTVTLGRSDALLVKEALEAVKSGEYNSPEKDEQIKVLINRINIQLAEEDVRSPLSHLWKPM